MARLSWIAPDGVEKVLYPPTGDVYLEGNTLEGFAGVWSDNPIQVVGEPGVHVDSCNRVVEPMTGAMSLRVRTVDGWQQLRRMFSESCNGWLVLDGWRLGCRLAEGLPGVGATPKRGTVLAVSLVADGGVWVWPVTGTGNVTVTNSGDVPVWPKIRWKGAGGRVLLPSGASFTLPTSGSPRVVDLKRSAAGKVLTETGVIDRELSAKIEVISEMVPPGSEGRFTVPDGATLTYEIGVLDVFKEVPSWS